MSSLATLRDRIDGDKQFAKNVQHLVFNYTSPKENLAYRVARIALDSILLAAAPVAFLLGSPLAFAAIPLTLHVLAKHWGIYARIHALFGRLAVPASNPNNSNWPDAKRCREENDLDGLFAARVAGLVDGVKVDGMIIGKKENFGNGKWFLFSNPNAGWYEKVFQPTYPFKTLVEASDRCAVLFNYPGVGESEGLVSRSGMAAAYDGYLTYIEEKLGGTNIVGVGHSIGAGAQAEALARHKFKKGVNYGFVASRTFATFCAAVADLVNGAAAFAMRLAGWNFDCVAAYSKTPHPVLILQTSKGEPYAELKTDQIINDEIIGEDVALAAKLPPGKNRFFMGIPEDHNAPDLSNPKAIIDKIEEMMR